MIRRARSWLGAGAWLSGRLAAVALAASLLACRTTNVFMEEASGIEPLLHPGDEAVVVFLRPEQFLATPRTTTVFDITDGVELVGIFSNDMKRILVVPPGERFFMGVLSGRRSVMRAELEAGRIYYVKIFAHQVHPLFPDQQEEAIRSYWHECVLMKPNDFARKWLDENRASVEKHRVRALERWPTLSRVQQAAFELRPGDGVTTAIR